MKTLRVKVTTTEELLGTASSDKDIHKEFIASKAPDAPSMEEEVAAVGAEEVFDKSMTIFPPGRGRKADCLGLPVEGIFQGRLRHAAEGERQRLRQDQGIQEGN